MTANSNYIQKISGADKFQLLIDRHIRLNQQTGNVIRLSIELQALIDGALITKAVKSNQFLTEINSLQVKSAFLRIPEWQIGAQKNQVEITEHRVEEDSLIPDAVLTRDIQVNSGHLIHIDLIHGNTNSIIVIAAHHVIADNRGLQSIAKIISESIEADIRSVFPIDTDKTGLITQLTHTLKATFLVFKKSPRTLSKLTNNEARTKFKVIRFSHNETTIIDDIAARNGASLTKSSFYLTATAMVLSRFIFKHTGMNFFLPVLQDQRLRGNDQIVLGNQLSFLFYKIPFAKLERFSEAITFVSNQFKEQVKNQTPKSYSYLLKTFRFLPLSVYNFFFKLPTTGAVSSFLFSDIGETLPDMKTFLGHEVKEVLNFSPNPSPPGITFIYMKHFGALKIVIAYNNTIIPDDEITRFETSLRLLLKR